MWTQKTLTECQYEALFFRGLKNGAILGDFTQYLSLTGVGSDAQRGPAPRRVGFPGTGHGIYQTLLFMIMIQGSGQSADKCAHRSG